MNDTPRKYKNIETGREYNLCRNEDTHEFNLVYQSNKGSSDMVNGTEVNGFYLCASYSVDIKLNGKKVVCLPVGSFYNIKQDEQVTHKKFIGISKRFVKV